MVSPNYLTRVLVVDDEPVILTTMSAIMERNGCTVRTAEDGFAGLKLLRETLPDIIITDLRMPNMSGFEFLSIVRRRFPHIPTIAISGEFISESMPAGLLVDALLQKGGYTPQQLFDLMKDLLTRSPIRPHMAKPEKAPLWIPRRETGYIVVTCTECLRSFPVDDTSVGSEERRATCVACETVVNYLVDSSVLKMLKDRSLRLPTR